MTQSSHANMEEILNAVPHIAQGPGGAVAAIKDGELIGMRTWGYANLDHRRPMTADTVFPICSISKQMVCLAMVSICRNPTPAMLMKKQDPWEQLNAEMRKLLPNLDGIDKLTVQHLANMQSGIRDYWAMTTLYGARPDDPFSIQLDAPETLKRTKTFHFAPGTEYSYSNVNFHVLGRIVEEVSGQSLAQTLAERVFIPAGMKSATLYINTAGLPQPIVGYEGNEKVGWFAATNRMEWAGDAGIGASLNDMIAYEKYLDRSYSDASSLYHFTSQHPKYNDGTPAHYGFGLSRESIAGREAIGHGGALRGFRHSRVHIPSERTSFVVLLNYETNPSSPWHHIYKTMIGYEDTQAQVINPGPDWEGDFLDEEGTKLVLCVKKTDNQDGHISIFYGPGCVPDTIRLVSDELAEGDDMKARIDGNTLHVEAITDNRKISARRIKKPTEAELHSVKSENYTGKYHCEEADSVFHCTGDRGTLYGSFDGFMGKGPVWLMRYIGEDVWILGTPRGLDSTPPGDWTVIFHRGTGGKVEGVTIGCWLARKNGFVRVS